MKNIVLSVDNMAISEAIQAICPHFELKEFEIWLKQQHNWIPGRLTESIN